MNHDSIFTYFMRECKSVRDFFEGASSLSQEQIEMVLVVIKATRGIFGMSQSELARLSGVSRPTISRIETGNFSVVKVETMYLLLRVSMYLGLIVEDDKRGLVLRLPFKGIDRCVHVSSNKDVLLKYEIEDLDFIITRMEEDLGSDASPKKVKELIKQRDALIKKLKKR